MVVFIDCNVLAHTLGAKNFFYISIQYSISLLQLDANLVEGELYNRLARKKHKDYQSVASKFKLLRKCGKPVSKTRQDQQRQCGPGSVSSTHRIFFAPTHPPKGQKTSLVNFKHKITTSANYTDGIGTGYTSHDNEMCLHITDLKKPL